MRRLTVALLAGTACLPLPAAAQEAATLRTQIEAMQAQIERLSAQVAQLEAQQKAVAVAPPVTAVEVPVPKPPPASAAPVAVAWKGGPELSGTEGYTFKPRGRLQIDTAVVAAPSALAGVGKSLGHATELRRAFIGIEGTLPGGFGYRSEVDIANSSIEIADLYLTYRATPELLFTIGHYKPFWGLEEITSDLFTSMRERAAFNSAFGFERRVGVSGSYTRKDFSAHLGVFTDNAGDLNSDTDNNHSLDGRVVFAPKIGKGQLHIGASAHIQDFNDSSPTARYRARPFTHTTDIRLVDTRAFSATRQLNFGGELAYIKGPFHATAEAHVMTARRPGLLPDPTFWGGYAEIGIFLTPGDTSGYRGGVYDRIRPVRPVDKGGVGAIQLNTRWDSLDLTDGAIVGGQQDVAALSLIWVPTEYIRFLADYGHLWLTDAAIRNGTSGDYQADTFGLRAQFDF